MIRMKAENALPAWLQTAGIDEINLSEPVRRLLGVFLASDEQLFLYRIGNVLLAALHEPQAAERIRAELLPGDVLCINGRVPSAVFSWSRWAECHLDDNHVYEGSAPLSISLPEGAVLRPLQMRDLAYVYDHYETVQDEAFLSGRIAAGMIGIEAEGSLRGFIGCHPEGTMGILAVEPAWRRKHLGRALEAAMINAQLSRGIIPFCQVDIHNEASRQLQRSLGMACSRHPVSWFF